MSSVFRIKIALGLAALAAASTSGLRATDGPEGDLTPLAPLARTLFSSNQNSYAPMRSPIDVDQEPLIAAGGSQSISANGKWLLTNSGGGLALFDLGNRHQKQPRTFNTGRMDLDDSLLAISLDGKTAVAGPQQNRGEDLDIRFFDTSSGKQIREIDNDQAVFGLALSPDGHLLAVGTEQRIELWTADDGEEVRLFSGVQNGNYRLLTFSPDGKMLAALGAESDTVHIWETATGKERTAIAVTTSPLGMHDGGRGRAMARIVAMGRLAPVPVVAGENASFSGILALAFSADSRLLAASDQNSTVHLWDLHTHRELPPLTGFRGLVGALAFSADGKELIGVETGGTLLNWRMAALRRNANLRLPTLDDADFAELWDDLAEADVFRIYRARRYLVGDPKRAVTLLSRHLKPAPVGDTARIEKLIKDLSSANAGTRRKAMNELRSKHGEAALGALMQTNGGGEALPPLAPGGPPGAGGDNQAALLLLQKLYAKYNTPEHQRSVRAAQILEEIGTLEARQTLAKLSKGAAGVNLTVASKAALERLDAAAKEKKSHSASVEELWADVASSDAAKAFQAMCRLAAAPKQAAGLIGKELKPIPVVEDKEIAALLDDLSSDDFKVREKASEALDKISEQALPAMKKALNAGVALEARKRLQRLVEQATAQSSPSLVRALRAIEVLEHTGLTESKQILLSLAGGAPQALVSREAKASLQRLNKR